MREHVTMRAGFARARRSVHAPIILSSGFHELIEPVLARERVELEVRANRLDARPGRLAADLARRGVCAVCGEACKRRSLADASRYVFVGDGYSDRCAALAADRVFARDGLARYLDEQGVPYEPFETLHDVAAALS